MIQTSIFFKFRARDQPQSHWRKWHLDISFLPFVSNSAVSTGRLGTQLVPQNCTLDQKSNFPRRIGKEWYLNAEEGDGLQVKRIENSKHEKLFSLLCKQTNSSQNNTEVKNEMAGESGACESAVCYYKKCLE
jgi:hypothetical protein